MNYQHLSLHQAPPIGVPLRFFLTAPPFAVLFALGLLFNGPIVLQDRWAPASLGITHLFTLGFITMIMFGALMQLLPVLVGTPVARPGRISTALHLLLTSGTLLLAAGLWSGNTVVLSAAFAVLLLVFSVFMLAAASSLLRTPATHPTIWAIRLALMALLLAVSIGLLLAGGHAWDAITLDRRLTDVHLTWILVGWIGFSITGFAYHLVPMFQMTPDYPALMMRLHVPLMFSLLLLWSVSALLSAAGGGYWSVLNNISATAIATGLAFFAIMTLRLQAQRRRRLPDVSLRYWRVGMLSLLLCVLLWATGTLWPGEQPSFLDTLVVVLYLAGFVTSVITGMLYKIVPFLVWLHSQQWQHKKGVSRGKIPGMKKIIPEQWAYRQFLLQQLALILILLAVIWPAGWTYAAAVALCASWLMLWFNLLRGVKVYKRFVTTADENNDRDPQTTTTPP